MKKTLITTLLLMTGCLCLKANAGLVVMDYQGDTVVHQNSIERNLLINCNDDGAYDIAIRPLEDAMTSSDGKVSIPLENVYINNTREDVYMRYNRCRDQADCRLRYCQESNTKHSAEGFYNGGWEKSEPTRGCHIPQR